MVLTKDKDGELVAISQPAHAWISGQIARAWGNSRFDPVPEEVCLAAEQHDIGFLEWERDPTLNVETGLPCSFMEMPTRMHLDIWTAGIRHMLRFGRYPALLVSMHFTNIARQKWLDDGEESAMVAAYLAEQEALQTTLRTSLGNDYYYQPCCPPETVLRHQQLVSAWDWISLLLCLGLRETQEIPRVPARTEMLSMRLSPAGPESGGASLDPWPFSAERLLLRCDGRRLLKTYTDEHEMREDLRRAAPLTVTFELHPA